FRRRCPRRQRDRPASSVGNRRGQGVRRPTGLPRPRHESRGLDRQRQVLDRRRAGRVSEFAESKMVLGAVDSISANDQRRGERDPQSSNGRRREHATGAFAVEPAWCGIQWVWSVEESYHCLGGWKYSNSAFGL
ncbi:hypothetical protein T310_8969, partial [Rasamsonia emersonii CBS 393.64]